MTESPYRSMEVRKARWATATGHCQSESDSCRPSHILLPRMSRTEVLATHSEMCALQKDPCSLSNLEPLCGNTVLCVLPPAEAGFLLVRTEAFVSQSGILEGPLRHLIRIVSRFTLAEARFGARPM